VAASSVSGYHLSVKALRLLRHSLSRRISALSQRPGPYGHRAPFVIALFYVAFRQYIQAHAAGYGLINLTTLKLSKSAERS
jgi:hypothetical protein